ncbi:ABC transporter substrate-binding protein [Williamsia sterculiae]|uniref:Peptide/nickel transport system substrate-binding protein n=1 Tax=Williamsia sterculiae TaxID=1344003 RepID=A0A1N7D199_9NOCA|nr:ABC transporter substrate-binding protein [Williamsia sterculiae]SIR69609.1 peptide/nickel transport system substrate-binding protein [Williamsia sterculiae]
MSDLRSSIESADKNHRRRWPWFVLALIVVIVVVVVIVVSVSGGSSSDTASSDNKPVSGGTLNFSLIDYQRSPDPQLGTNYAESLIASNVTDKLLWQDPKTGELTPWLATKWQYNPQLTEFTFTLRDGVTFSDGAPFNAEAVKLNFDQYIKGDAALDIKPNGAPLFPGYLGTDVIDDHTVKLRFSKPLASALQATSFTGNAGPGFLSPNTLKLTGAQRSADVTKVVGTGPFVYQSWKPQVETVVVRRKGYNWAPPALKHQGEAYLDKIVFRSIPESSVRTGSLTSHAVDATLDVGTTDEKSLSAQGFKIISRPVSGTAIFFNFNSQLFPTNDIAVRKAIQLGWNRDAVTKTVLTPSYSVATSVLLPSVPGYVDYSKSVLNYKPEEAAKLLDDAGWKTGPDGIRVKDGRRLAIKTLGINNLVVNSPAYQSIQQDLKKIGIDLQLTVLPIPDYTAQQAKAKADWNIVAANRSRDDASVLNLQYNPQNGNGNYLDANSTGVNVAEVTDALERIETTLDTDQRNKYTAAAQDLLVQKYALVNPVYNPSQVIAHAPSVHGIVFDAQSRNTFVDTWKAGDK